MPKVATFLSFLFLFPGISKAQIAVELSKMNKLYPAVDNPLTVAVNDVPDSNLLLIPSVGKILKNSSPGNYVWQICQSDSATATLTVLDSVKNEVLARKIFRVGVFPEPVPLLGARNKSKVLSSGEFCAQGGISLILECFDFDAKVDLLNYQVVYIAKGQDLIFMENQGARFETEVQHLVNKAKPGDIYIFRRFVYRVPCGSMIRYSGEELIFRIK